MHACSVPKVLNAADRTSTIAQVKYPRCCVFGGSQLFKSYSCLCGIRNTVSSVMQCSSWLSFQHFGMQLAGRAMRVISVSACVVLRWFDIAVSSLVMHVGVQQAKHCHGRRLF
jgi:cytochrome bd-type quinol oxidase subunit 2